MKIYNIRLDEDRAKKAKEHAFHEKISTAEHIRRCIDLYDALWLAQQCQDPGEKEKHTQIALIKYL